MKDLAKLFQVLSDSTRLRILNLLQFGSLNVLEIQKILKASQSATSRHLGILRDHGLIQQHRSGQSVYYSSQEYTTLPDAEKALLETLQLEFFRNNKKEEEEAYFEIIRDREKKTSTFFSRHHSLWEKIREEIYSHAVDTFLVGSLVPSHLRIIDVGSGIGHFLQGISTLVHQPVGLDNQFSILSEAKERMTSQSHINWICANALHLPIKSTSFDAVFCNLVLHYLPDPKKSIQEMARICSNTGKVIILDILPIHSDWYDALCRKLDFQWDGFEPETIESWIRQNGFCHIKSRIFEHEIQFDIGRSKQGRVEKRRLKYFAIVGQKCGN